VLGRVLAVLEAFSTGEPTLSLAELTVRTKIPNTFVHRIVKEFVENRLLERGPAGFRLSELAAKP
jgi:DNA-binding IclR family transcriptional regulator